MVVKFNRWKTAACSLIILAMIGGLIFLPLAWPGGLLVYLETKPQWAGPTIAILPGALWLGWLALENLHQALFDGARALWVEDGTLIFTNRRVWKAPLANIDRFEAGTFRARGIAIKDITIFLKDGGQKIISTALLRSSQAETLAALNALLKK